MDPVYTFIGLFAGVVFVSFILFVLYRIIIARVIIKDTCETLKSEVMSDRISEVIVHQDSLVVGTIIVNQEEDNLADLSFTNIHKDITDYDFFDTPFSVLEADLIDLDRDGIYPKETDIENTNELLKMTLNDTSLYPLDNSLDELHDYKVIYHYAIILILYIIYINIYRIMNFNRMKQMFTSMKSTKRMMKKSDSE
jgi:hypothetical protein